jgi:hypothetical protein
MEVAQMSSAWEHEASLLGILEVNRADHPEGLTETELLQRDPEMSLRGLKAAVEQLEGEGKVRRVQAGVGAYRIALADAPVSPRVEPTHRVVAPDVQPAARTRPASMARPVELPTDDSLIGRMNVFRVVMGFSALSNLLLVLGRGEIGEVRFYYLQLLVSLVTLGSGGAYLFLRHMVRRRDA